MLILGSKLINLAEFARNTSAIVVILAIAIQLRIVLPRTSLLILLHTTRYDVIVQVMIYILLNEILMVSILFRAEGSLLVYLNSQGDRNNCSQILYI